VVCQSSRPQPVVIWSLLMMDIVAGCFHQAMSPHWPDCLPATSRTHCCGRHTRALLGGLLSSASALVQLSDDTRRFISVFVGREVWRKGLLSRCRQLASTV